MTAVSRPAGPARSALHSALRSAVRTRLIVRHYVDAIAPWPQLRGAPAAYRRYLADRRRYAQLSGERLDRYDDDPQLHDWTATTPFDPHYTHQDAWAAREIFERRPAEHVDVGSRVSFVIGLAAFVPVTFVDVRPLPIELPNLNPIAGSLLEMPFADRAVASLSCLHVAEHVGLGRYGDPLDPSGTVASAAELARVLAPGGTLWFGLPVGRPRTNFNAHRVHDPRDVPGWFEGLRLDAFAGVDDDGRFLASAEPAALADCEWACGLYRFTRDA